MGDLRVRVLGGLEVEGFSPQQVGSRKARTLVKVLALAPGRAVPLATVVDALWPDGPPSRPADQVGVLVSRLRGVLGADRLVREEGGYRLAYDWLDIVELEARVAEARARLAVGATGAAGAVAEAAMALARGPLLPDDEGPWVEGPRAAVERLVAEAQALTAEAALAAGDPATAASAAGRALDRDPFDEVALRLLMRAHARAGRPASALDAYARTREVLADELGVSPTDETEALHLAILRGDPPPAERAAGDLGMDPVAERPNPLHVRAAVVGREAELSWLDARLGAVRGAEGAAVVALEGEAGIGKSALVGAWAAGLDDAVVLEARCDPLGRDLPLQPVLEAVDRHLASLGAEAEAVLGPDAATVGRFLPAGRATAAPAGGRATALADTQADRAALFASLVDVVGRLGAGRPVVLVVDDVHLADESTGDWLRVAGRRGRGLLAVVTTRPGAALPVTPDATLTLGPLDLATAARLVGDDRAAALHERSGGHPLFLLALAASEGEGGDPGNGDALPVAVTAAVAERLAALGGAAPTLVAAAVLGPEVDVGLLADVLGRPAPVLLDDLEAGLAQRALVERGSGFAFAHELVREAAAATASASRRALLHRGAAHALRRRPDAEMLAVARHARLGGDRAQAARALVAAADSAAGRSDHRAALTLLDQAVTLTTPAGDLRASRPDGPMAGAETPANPGGERSASRPGPAAGIGPSGGPGRVAGGIPAPGPPAAEALLARARVRLVLRDLEGAADDAAAAIAAGAGVAGFETAGWVAYYRRDLGAALRYAEEGVVRAADDELRASCLCLAGRVRESQGELAAAEGRLTAALDAATPGLRPLAAIWLGTLRVHQGRTAEADDLLARGLLDRSQLAHPFAVPHALISQCHAAGMAGRVGEAMAATEALVVGMEGGGDRGTRYVPAARNYRAWVLRAVGRAAEADDLNEAAREATAAARLEEPYNQGTLDLADGRLAAGDLDGATALLDELRGLDRADTVMGWSQRERAGTLAARLALAAGRPEEALAEAGAVERDASARGSVRHAAFARVVAALARLALGATGGDRQPADADAPGADLVAALDALAPVAGLEAWRWTAEAARMTGDARLRHAAERRAAGLLAALPAGDRPPAEALVARWLP